MLLLPHTQEQLDAEITRLEEEKKAAIKDILLLSTIRIQEYFSQYDIGWHIYLSVELTDENLTVFTATKERDNNLEYCEAAEIFIPPEALSKIRFKDCHFLNNGLNFNQIEQFFLNHSGFITPEQKKLFQIEGNKIDDKIFNNYNKNNQEFLKVATVVLAQCLLNLPDDEFNEICICVDYDKDNYKSLMIQKYNNDTGFYDYLELENLLELSQQCLGMIMPSSLELNSKEDISKLYEWMLGSEGKVWEQEVKAASMHAQIQQAVPLNEEKIKNKRKI